MIYPSIGVLDAFAEIYSMTSEPNLNLRENPPDYDFSQEAKSLLDRFFADRIDANSHVNYDIVNLCKDSNNLQFVISVLTDMDRRINMESIINNFDLYRVGNTALNKTFDGLNENKEETGILVVPKVKTPIDTFYDGRIEKEYQTAYSLTDYINSKLTKLMCISKKALEGFNLQNIILNPFKFKEVEKIRIGVTPCCSNPIDSLFDFEEYIDEDGVRLEYIKERKADDLLFNRFSDVLLEAKKQRIDILLGAELCGTLEMTNYEGAGYLNIFHDKNDYAPFLIIPPTFWNVDKNYTDLFINNGKHIGRQYKQNRYVYTKAGKKIAEGLKNIPNDILLLHMPGIGRIVVSVCIDYITPNFRDLLVRTLHANLILVPSYTKSTVQFGNAMTSVREYGTNVIWSNSCSALNGQFTDHNPLCAIATPISNTERFDEALKVITPNCGGKCDKGCLNIFEIQLKGNESNHHNEVAICHVPLL